MQYNTITGDINIYTLQAIFDLTGYKANLGNLKFGIWNTTDEVPLPVYNVQMLDVNGKLVSGGLSVFGTAPTVINKFGTHTDANFLDGIPGGTQQIIVTANLPPLKRWRWLLLCRAGARALDRCHGDHRRGVPVLGCRWPPKAAGAVGCGSRPAQRRRRVHHLAVSSGSGVC